MKLLRQILAFFTAPCCTVELPAALPNGKTIAITVGADGVTTTQECPNCEGRGFHRLHQAAHVLYPCNRCDTTGEIRG